MGRVRHSLELTHHFSQMSPLHCAVLSGNEELVCYFLEIGDSAGVLCTNKEGLYPIQLACRKGLETVVRKLCALPCSKEFVNIRDAEGGTLLHLAVAEGHCGVARALLEAGACDLKAEDSDGFTALRLAEALEDQDMVDEITREQGRLGVSSVQKALEQAQAEDFRG